jgi:pyruvate-ferredoxin/flavodoxin oxidoreductase
MSEALNQQEKAVDSGYWPLFRYDPRRVAQGESPLKLDSAAPKIDLARFVESETRFRQVEQANPEGFKKMLDQAQKNVKEKYALYEQLARAMNPANLVPGAAGTNGKPRA